MHIRVWLTVAGALTALAYVGVCFKGKADLQVNVAMVLTVVFAMVMAGTVVGM